MWVLDPTPLVQGIVWQIINLLDSSDNSGQTRTMFVEIRAKILDLGFFQIFLSNALDPIY